MPQDNSHCMSGNPSRSYPLRLIPFFIALLFLLVLRAGVTTFAQEPPAVPTAPQQTVPPIPTPAPAASSAAPTSTTTGTLRGEVTTQSATIVLGGVQVT